MSDLPPFNDNEILPFDSDDEKPKRPLILSDGELPYEVEVEKPKKRPPSRVWQKTYIPIPLLLAICALLICSAVLLLGTSLFRGSIVCAFTTICSGEPTSTWIPTLSHDPRPPLIQERLRRIIMGQDSYYDVTLTPAVYTAARCDPDRDYQNHIMFTMEEGANAEIFLTDPTGAMLCRLTDNLIEESQVDWSPDRKHILFSSTRAGESVYSDIYVMDFDGTNIVNLTQDQALDGGAVWSADGTQIAFGSGRTGTNHIYVMNADGSNQRDLTPEGLNAQSPEWSPDGTRLAYVSGVDNDPNKLQVSVVDVTTAVSQRLTYGSTTSYSPIWIGDGSQLIYKANVVSALGNYQGTGLFVLSVSESSVPQRFIPLGDASWFSLSPNGKSIAFVNNYTLNTLDLATGQKRLLSRDHQVRFRPSWR